MRTTKRLRKTLESANALDFDACVVRAMALANETVHAGATQNGMRGAGCTAAAVRFAGGQITLAWAGDVEAALLRGTKLTVLTRVHSLANEYVRSGAVAADDPRIADLPTDMIVRALGMGPSLDVDAITENVVPGDLVVLTSDALRALVEEPRFALILIGANHDPRRACDALLVSAAPHRFSGIATAVVIAFSGSDNDPIGAAAHSITAPHEGQ